MDYNSGLAAIEEAQVTAQVIGLWVVVADVLLGFSFCKSSQSYNRAA